MGASNVLRLTLLLLLAGCSTQPAFASKDAVHRISLQSGEVCGATAVGRRTLLSASHCIPEDAKVILVNGTLVGILHIERDGSDHALVVVTRTFPHFVKLSASRPVQGDKIHLWGNPAGWADMYREGIVSGSLPDGKVIADSNSYFGDSGSGVWNERGELIGVVSAIAGHGIFKVTVMYPFRYTAEQWATVK